MKNLLTLFIAAYSISCFAGNASIQHKLESCVYVPSGVFFDSFEYDTAVTGPDDVEGDRRDPKYQGGLRYMVYPDQQSLDQRYKELKFHYGKLDKTLFFSDKVLQAPAPQRLNADTSREKWCSYDNARTARFDFDTKKWSKLSSCVLGSISTAVCCVSVTAPVYSDWTLEQ